nr:MAG TPA: Minor capsid protein from bacteriophage [Caudoviricetes sp.]
MPPENGISMAYSSGSLETYLNKKAAVTMSVVLNGKHDNQQTVLDTLGKIHTYLNMRNTYPQANNFQIVNILTTSPPSYLGREENRQWLYGSSLAIRFYLKGD